MEKGTIFKFHNDLDTDQIIASQYLLLPNLDEMKGHTFESLDPDFAKKVKPGDFVVGGENFGCGSSREQAPGVLKALGVQAVIAKSFARIFFRNAINIGLPAIVCKDLPDDVQTGDTMELHMSDGDSLEAQNQGMSHIRSGYMKQSEYPLLAVFDGMGGESCGEMAAFLAAEACGEHFKTAKDGIRNDPEEFLNEICESMNQAICDYGRTNKINSMGTTAAL